MAAIFSHSACFYRGIGKENVPRRRQIKNRHVFKLPANAVGGIDVLHLPPYSISKVY
jgi:hypothetical protein